MTQWSWRFFLNPTTNTIVYIAHKMYSYVDCPARTNYWLRKFYFFFPASFVCYVLRFKDFQLITFHHLERFLNLFNVCKDSETRVKTFTSVYLDFVVAFKTCRSTNANIFLPKNYQLVSCFRLATHQLLKIVNS